MILTEKIEKNSLILMWPVTLLDRTKRPDDPSYEYHITWKFFGETDMDIEPIIDLVESMYLPLPTDKKGRVCLAPIILSGKDGTQEIPVLYVSSMPKALFDMKSTLDRRWPDTFPVYKPHISVEPELFDALSRGTLTVSDLNITVSDLVLKKGGDTLHAFPSSRRILSPEVDAFGIPASA